jgi:DNA-binding beta-propeller fold protein YncE
MLPTRRSTARAIAVFSAVAVVATACTSVTEPTLSPGDALAARREVLTHPVGTLAERVQVGSLPWGVAVSSRGDVLAGLPFTSTVVGFSLSDPTTLRPPVTVSAYPLDVIFNKKGSLAYASGRDGGGISEIDIRTNTVGATIPLGPDLYRLALSKDETRIYATTLQGRLWTARTHGDPRATYVDLSPFSSIQGKSLSPSGTDLYVASTNGTIWRLDPVTLAVRQSVVLPRFIQDIAATPDGSAVWAADENGFVVRLDPMTLAPTATIDLSVLGGWPFGLAISPDGARIYVASSMSGKLFIIAETAPNSFDVTSVATGGTPRRIAFGENGAAAVVSNEWGWVDVVR